jgi:hypothetical protein
MTDSDESTNHPKISVGILDEEAFSRNYVNKYLHDSSIKPKF